MMHTSELNGGHTQLTNLLNILTGRPHQSVDTLKTRLAKKKNVAQGERIFNCLDTWLLDDEQKQMLQLHPWNIFFLYAAASLWDWPDTIDQPTAADRLKDVCYDTGIDDSRQADILALLCKTIHNNVSCLSLSDEPEHIIYQQQPINILLLARAVQTAALLDLECGRTVREIRKYLPDGCVLPFEEIRDRITVSYAGPHRHLSGTIQVQITCRDPEIHRALKQHENRLQQLLHETNSQVSPRFYFSEVIFEIKPEGYTPCDMKYAVDSIAALHLLTGNRLYTDRRVFLRELIQNAVDAFNLRKIFQPDHQPVISVDIDHQARIIQFTDNGVGMDRQWIEKYFLKIGISFYQSGNMKHINQHHVDFNFISKFGIGFLSSFMVAEKIVIQTRKENSSGLLITITNLQNYFDVRPAPDDCPVGTKVTLYLKESRRSLSRAMEFILYLKTNLRFLSVPVRLSDYQGSTTVLGQERLKYLKGDDRDREFIAKLGFEHSEGYLFMKAKKSQDILYALDSAKGGISIFQDGIFVTQTDTLLPEGARQNVIGRINLIGRDRCELSMDRNRIFWTDDQLRSIKQIVRLGLVDLASQILVSTASRMPPLIVEQSVINHLAIFFNFNEVNDEIYQCLPQSLQKIVAKRFRDFVRVHFAHTQSKSHVPEADGYAEKWQQTILDTFKKRSRPPLPAT